MSRRWLLIAGLASVGSCLTPVGAAAWSPPPMPTYTITTGTGSEFLFVMLGQHTRLYEEHSSAKAIRAA